jgi:hypothetical protein
MAIAEVSSLPFIGTTLPYFYIAFYQKSICLFAASRVNQ